MKRVLAVTGYATVLAVGIAALPYVSHRVPSTSQVLVHCPNGNQPAFVTPAQVTIAVGDSIVWRMTGQVASDTLVISLKDGQQAWPFSGAVPHGKSSARTGSARVPGTYGYNVDLECRLPGGGTQSVTIDPDIIIE